ncbi:MULTISPECIES: hypothetical protein [Paracoccaceae]|uniref:hypothetical protein n=1 Tax=Paracoccaceae TaxID=31989 RepID=UPI003298C8A2
MKLVALVALFGSFGVALMADTAEQTSPCVDIVEEAKSPDPVISPDGFGQAVGERGDTNADTEEGDPYTGDPAYGDCDGR